jgi:hypothetical protein
MHNFRRLRVPRRHDRDPLRYAKPPGIPSMDRYGHRTLESVGHRAPPYSLPELLLELDSSAPELDEELDSSAPELDEELDSSAPELLLELELASSAASVAAATHAVTNSLAPTTLISAPASLRSCWLTAPLVTPPLSSEITSRATAGENNDHRSERS